MKAKIHFATIALLVVLASPSFAVEGDKLGMVDVQKVLVLSDAGKEGKEQLTATAARLEKQKDLLDGELARLRAALEKEGVLWSEAERSAKEKEYEHKLQEYQQFLKKAQDEFQARNEELTKAIVEEIIKVIDDYGRKNAYSIIFIKNENVVYVDGKTDLTAEILKMLNSLKKADSGPSGG